MKKAFFLLLGGMVAATGMGLGGAEFGSGDGDSRVEELRNIDGVHLTTIGTLYVMQGNKEELVISGDDNVINKIVTEVQDNVLVIRKKRNAIILNQKTPLEYYLTIKNLESLKLSGSGNAKLEELKAGEFTVSVSGSGEVVMDTLDLSKNLGVTTSGSGGVVVKKLQLAESLKISTSGSGGVEINDLEMGDEISLRISGSGSIDLSGFADAQKITSLISGAGDITLSGSARALDHESNGSGKLEAEDMELETAAVRLSGSGRAEIGTIKETVSARLSGAGDLIFGGNPRLGEVRTSGSGTLKQRD